MSKKVEKMLSPEETTVLSNIASMVNELMQMNQGVPAEEVTEAEVNSEDTMDEATDEKEVKMIVKGLETTPSEAATASDDAEDRMDESQTELSEENLQEVAKAINMILKGNKVKKSQPKENSQLNDILGKIVEVQKSSQESVNELTTAFGHVLEGLGISKQLEVTKSIEERDDKINKGSNEELLNFLKQITKSEEKAEPKMSQGNSVRKNLANADVLKGLLVK